TPSLVLTRAAYPPASGRPGPDWQRFREVDTRGGRPVSRGTAARAPRRPDASVRRVEAAPGPQGHVHEPDEDRDLDEGPDHPGQSLPGGDPEHADGHGDRQL